jgi:hypothetical protein
MTESDSQEQKSLATYYVDEAGDGVLFGPMGRNRFQARRATFYCRWRQPPVLVLLVGKPGGRYIGRAIPIDIWDHIQPHGRKASLSTHPEKSACDDVPFGGRCMPRLHPLWND